MSAESSYPARWHHALPDGRVMCDLCPRDCTLQDGQRGLCFVRQRRGEGMVLTTYGRSSGYCIDPIEKKPLSHFYPGSSVLSFGTAGCNLACKFCQNWDISRSRDVDTLASEASPEAIARAAQRWGCKSVAFTYNDPVIFAEYALDVADACHALGVQTVAVTAGYVHPGPRRELFAKMDAANVDLKSFREGFYEKLTAAHLRPVLETLQHIKHETRCWLEITTLLIPGQNDSDAEIVELATWIRDHLAADVPLHFSAFHPDYRMTDVPPTPPATLRRARDLARSVGLSFVYVGNVHDVEGETTYCVECGAAVIERDWYRLHRYALTAEGRCSRCGHRLPGCFDEVAGSFGRRRIPIHIEP